MRIRWSRGLRLGTTALAVLAGVVLAAEGALARPAQQAQAVSIVDFAFNPAALTVPVGAQVTWTNTGQAPHTSSSTTGAWDSGRLEPGGRFSFTFTSAGSFPYRCNIHPSMQGTITVQGAAAAPAPAPAAATPAAQPAAMPRTGVGNMTEGGLPRWWLAPVASALALAGAAGVRRLYGERSSRRS